MGIESKSPAIVILRKFVEEKYGHVPRVPYDFVELSEIIGESINEKISSSTLQRIWGYAAKTYASVSLYSLEVLCKYCGFETWKDFCYYLKEKGIKDSDLIEGKAIYSEDLEPDTILQIGWAPDRICLIKYLGNYRYLAIKCENSTMRPGDTFSCIEFILNQPAVLDKFIAVGKPTDKPKRYIVGSSHGLSIINIIKEIFPK